MKRRLPLSLAFALALTLALSLPALAHFGMVIPDKNVVTQDDRSVNLILSFSHPFEFVGMDLVKPAKFEVFQGGKSQDLLGSLEKADVMGHAAWQAAFPVERPGVYQFVMEPVPYWEPAEDVSIIHYTKTVVAAFGDEDGWGEPLGLKTEIVPLSRPFASYQGFSFTGQVLMDGKPVPGAEVEVEYYDEKNQFGAPSDLHVTYVVRADDKGVFTFACPLAGWWGFAALNEADYTIKNPDGEDKGVELGAVLWVKMSPWSSK